MLQAARFMQLMGGPMLSFYDWYADLPPASPQIGGDQTDVPESSDWYNSGYIMDMGFKCTDDKNTDAHFLAEVDIKERKSFLSVLISLSQQSFCR